MAERLAMTALRATFPTHLALSLTTGTMTGYTLWAGFIVFINWNLSTSFGDDVPASVVPLGITVIVVLALLARLLFKTIPMVNEHLRKDSSEATTRAPFGMGKLCYLVYFLAFIASGYGGGIAAGLLYELLR